MELNNNNTAKPNAYRVDDDDNLKEKDLERNFLFGGDEEKHTDDPEMEGTGMGGQNFGKNNVTPSADDKANPSRNAGYTNDYFKRTEPAEEHPENSNFTSSEQSGQPNYSQAQLKGSAENPGPDKDDQQDTNTYQEGTADNDKSSDVNVPGPGELPDQQKVGESNDGSKTTGDDE